MTPEEAAREVQTAQVLANIRLLRDKILDVLAEERANPRVACLAMAFIQGDVLQGKFPGVDAEDIRIIREGIDSCLGERGKG